MRYKLLYNDEVYEVMIYERMALISDAEYRHLATYNEDEPRSYQRGDEILGRIFEKEIAKADEIDYSITYMEEYEAIKIGLYKDGQDFPDAYALVPENSPYFNLHLLTSDYELLDKFQTINVKGTQPWIFYYDMTDF